MQHNEIKGFTDQSERNKALVNRNKETEERILRILDELGQTPNIDPRMLALGRTGIEQAFMWINRSIFQPQRVVLPEDAEPVDPPPPAPPVHIGQVFRTVDDAQNREVIKDAAGNELTPVGPDWYRKSEWDLYQNEMAAYKARQEDGQA